MTLVHFAPAWSCLQLGNFMLHRLTGKLSGICQQFLEVVDRSVCWQFELFLGGGEGGRGRGRGERRGGGGDDHRRLSL